MKDITLVTVNWNQQPCVELLLKSYVKYHYCGTPLKLLLVDNDSDDGSREWMDDNDIPFVVTEANIGHENALNAIYDKIKTKYCLLNDTDVEYHDSVYSYLYLMNDYCISVGEMIDKNYMNDTKIKDRISPWFWLYDISKLKEAGVTYFRDPANENWTYDVASWQTEQLLNLGYTNHNLIRKPGHQDNDIVSMRYDKVDHIGKVSWNLDNHIDRYSEVMRRRQYVKDRLQLYEDIDLKGKFIL